MAPIPSFEADIRPLLEPYRGSMLWRLDLANYEHVQTNASLIYGRLISTDDPMPPKTTGGPQTALARRFKAWMDGGCPR